MKKNISGQSSHLIKTKYHIKQYVMSLVAFVYFVGIFVIPVAHADDTPTRTIKVDESETSLAKWFEVRESGEPLLEYNLGIGLRLDTLKWSIADSSANIASEVRWNSTYITQLHAAGTLNLNDSWQVRGTASTGAVRSGTNQDSDFSANDRSQEFSRSNNNSGGGVRDFSISIGKKFRRNESSNQHPSYLIPMLGLSAHQQNFTMTNGVQTIPANGPFPGLGNSYDTRWLGAWLGLEAQRDHSKHLTLGVKGQLHLIDYSAKANWNLRTDLAHPTSFKHSATGIGLVIGGNGIYRYNKNFLLNGAIELQAWRTGAGKDMTYFATGANEDYKLNSVHWNSTSIRLGGAYQF